MSALAATLAPPRIASGARVRPGPRLGALIAD